jgi:hypothetical protein
MVVATLGRLRPGVDDFVTQNHRHPGPCDFSCKQLNLKRAHDGWIGSFVSGTAGGRDTVAAIGGSVPQVATPVMILIMPAPSTVGTWVV